MAKDRVNPKFKDYINVRMNRLFDDILYNAEQAVSNPHQYKIFRSRVLRAGNNALRDLVDEVDYYSLSEDGPRKRSFDVMDVED